MLLLLLPPSSELEPRLPLLLLAVVVAFMLELRAEGVGVGRLNTEVNRSLRIVCKEKRRESQSMGANARHQYSRCP